MRFAGIWSLFIGKNDILGIKIIAIHPLETHQCVHIFTAIHPIVTKVIRMYPLGTLSNYSHQDISFCNTMSTSWWH